MKHYKDLNNKVYAFELDGSQDHIIPTDFIAITDEEANNLRQPSVLVNVPDAVTMRQARLALLQSGLLTAVVAAIAALPSPTKEVVQIEWEYSQTVERNRPFVLNLASALNLTSEQLDNLFILAKTL